MNKDGRALFNVQRLAGNAGTFRAGAVREDAETDTLEDYLWQAFKKGVELDEAKSLIKVVVDAELSLVDPTDMKKMETYLNQLLKAYPGPNPIPPAQFVGVEANNQFSIYLVFHVTDNPTTFRT